MEEWTKKLTAFVAVKIQSFVSNVRSAKEIVIEWKKGYVFEDHNTGLFV
jgi:hypothetical protein